MDLDFIFIGIVLTGCFAGFLGGLFGVGGGIFVVPALVALLKYLGFPANDLMEVAIGTSLSSMVFNSLNSFLCHRKHKTIQWQLVKKSLIPVLIGCFIGALIGHFLPTNTLLLIFSGFAFVLGFHFLLQKKNHPTHRSPHSNAFFRTATFSISSFSNILGVGGGVMTVPFFSKFYMPLKNAIGTSSVLTLLITFFGALSYFFLGVFSTTNQGPQTMGYIYIPAFVLISITSFFTARYGSYVSIILPTYKLEKYFGIFLLLVGLFMSFNALSR